MITQRVPLLGTRSKRFIEQPLRGKYVTLCFLFDSSSLESALACCVRLGGAAVHPTVLAAGSAGRLVRGHLRKAGRTLPVRLNSLLPNFLLFQVF